MSVLYINEEYSDIKIKSKTYIDCIFEDCNFLDVIFSECNFVNCKFINCKINNIRSVNSSMKNSMFHKCDIIVIDFNSFLSKGILNDVFIEIKDCNLMYCNFIKLNLNKFDFSSNSILKSFFEGCNLESSNFSKVILTGTEFRECNLKNSDFREASDYNIDIRSCNLEKSKYSFLEVNNLLKNLNIEIY